MTATWQDFFATGKPIETALPVAHYLTLPATGKRSRDGTVVTNEEAQLKLPYGDVILRPVFSIMNPELYFTLPENQVANGVCDMMSHIMERYFTNTTHTDVTDGLCESVLRTIMSNARILKRDHTNYDAWAEIALAGTVAHNGLLGLGREEDWGCHNMEHELSAIYDVAPERKTSRGNPSVDAPHLQRSIFRFSSVRCQRYGRRRRPPGSGGRCLEVFGGFRPSLQRWDSRQLWPAGIDSRHLAQMAHKATHNPTVLLSP